jgi:hypothetical protein
MKRLLLLIFILATSLAYGQIAKPVDKPQEPVFKVIRFYPNPAVSFINFEFQQVNQKGYTLQIYNFLGKKVSERTSVATKTTVDLTEFFRGLYIFQLRDKAGRIVESGKFQVVK